MPWFLDLAKSVYVPSPIDLFLGPTLTNFLVLMYLYYDDISQVFFIPLTDGAGLHIAGHFHCGLG